MNFFYVAALAKYANDKRYGKPSRKKTNSYDNKTAKFNNEDSERYHTYYDCVFKEIAYDNESLYQFFDLIYKEVENKKRQILNEYNKDLDELRKLILKKENELKEKTKELNEIGAKYYPEYFNLGIKFFSTEEELSGIDIKILLDDKTLEKYILDLREKAAHQTEYEIEKEASEQKVNHTRKKLKFTLSSKKRDFIMKNEINSEMLKINSIEKKLQESVVSKKVLEMYDTSYEKNKVNIQICIDKFLEYIELNQKEKNLENEKYKVDSYAKELKLYEEVFSSMLEENKVTKEQLQQVFLQLDKVEIKSRRNEYNLDFWSSNDGKCNHIKSLVKWFIKNVYEMDENFVYRNLYLEEEENDISSSKKL